MRSGRVLPSAGYGAWLSSHDGSNPDPQALRRRSGAFLRPVLAVAACCPHPFPPPAGDQRLTQLTHIPVSKVTQPPVGWIDFCERQPNECAGATMKVREFVITPKRWN